MATPTHLSTATNPEAPSPVITHDFPAVVRAIGALFRGLKELAQYVTNIPLVGDPSLPLHNSKAGNVDAVYLTVLSPSTPDEEFEVGHSLGRVPIGFDVCQVVGRPGVFYVSGLDYTFHGHDDRMLRLKCSTGSTKAVLRVF